MLEETSAVSEAFGGVTLSETRVAVAGKVFFSKYLGIVEKEPCIWRR